MSFATIEQESVLAVMAYDEGGYLTARAILPELAFDSVYRRFWAAIAAFIDKFNRPPGEHLLELASDLKERKPKDADIIDSVFASIKTTWDNGVNRDFVFDRARTYGRATRYMYAVEQTLKILEKGAASENVDAVEDILRKALSQSDDVESYGVSSHDEDYTAAIDEEENETFLTGIPEFDRIGAGPVKGGLFVYAGKYGSGKTFSAVHFARCCVLLNKLPVVIFSLEMSERKMARRVIGSLTATGRRDDEVVLTKFRKNKKGAVIDFKNVKMRVVSMRSVEGRRKAAEKLKQMKNRAPIIVKAYPSNSATVPMMRAFLQRLRTKFGIIPGMFIVDYLGIMQIRRPETKRLELGQHAIELRALAQEWGAAGVTFVQLNADGVDSNKARGTNIAEDKSITHHADRVWIYNQTEEEKRLGLARIVSEKNRDDATATVVVSQSYASHQFCIDSALVSVRYDRLVEQNGDDDGT